MPVYKRGETWWYRFKFRGLVVAESSKSSSKDVAGRLEREHRRKLELGQQGLSEIRKPKTFSVAVKEYIDFRRPHWADRTIEMHENSLLHLEPVFGKKSLTEITPTLISKYQSLRQAENASNKTINIELETVRLVLRKHKLWANISDEVKMLKVSKDKGRELTDDELERLFNCVKSSVSRTLYPAVMVSIHTGLRNEELRLLQWKQINFDGAEIQVGKSKTEGGEGRIVPLSKAALQTLTNWRREFPEAQPEHYVFPSERYALKGKKGTFGGTVVPYSTDPTKPIGSFKKAWTTAKRVAGVECRWHDLRHTAASLVAAGGATDQTMQDIFGWMSPEMIKRYSHVRDEARKQAVAVFDNVSWVQ